MAFCPTDGGARREIREHFLGIGLSFYRIILIFNSLMRKLPVENNQSILRSGQFSDADRVAPNQYERAHFGERFPIAGTDRAITGTNRGDRLSSKRRFIPWKLWWPPPVQRRRRTRPGNHPARVGVAGQNLPLRCTTGKPFQKLLNGDPVAANARFAESHVRINRDSF